jgi:WD40 repeat protein
MRIKAMFAHNKFDAKEEQIKDCAVLTDGQIATVSANSHEVSLWTRKASFIRRLSAKMKVQALLALPENRLAIAEIAGFGQPSTDISIWDTHTKTRIADLKVAGQVNKLSLSPEGGLVAMIELPQPMIVIWDAKFKVVYSEGISFSENLRFAPVGLSGGRFILSAYDSQEIELRNQNSTGSTVFLLNEKINAITAFSDDRILVAFDSHIAIYKIENNKLICLDDSYKLTSSCNSLLALDDGKAFVSSDKEGNVTLWDTENKKSTQVTNVGIKDLVFTKNSSMFMAYEKAGKQFMNLEYKPVAKTNRICDTTTLFSGSTPKPAAKDMKTTPPAAKKRDCYRMC